MKAKCTQCHAVFFWTGSLKLRDARCPIHGTPVQRATYLGQWPKSALPIALPQAPRPPRHESWTRVHALIAGRAFVAREHRLPQSDDCHASMRLPQAQAIRRLFGTMDAYLQCLPAPPPLPIPDARRCLSCETLFQPAAKDCWLCASCKREDAWREGDALAWMNGVDGVPARWMHQ